MFRVLKSGGRVGVSDVVAEDHLTAADRADRGSYLGCIAGALSKSEYLDGLTAVGFVDAAVEFTHEAVPGMHGAIVGPSSPESLISDPARVTAPAGATLNIGPPVLWRRAAAEAVGTGTLVAAVVPSGIMAGRLSGDVLLQLFVNAAATVAVLCVLIAVLSPVIGAHLNPAVTLLETVQRRLPAGEAGVYVGSQLVGGLVGVAEANLMFDLPAH